MKGEKEKALLAEVFLVTPQERKSQEMSAFLSYRFEILNVQNVDEMVN